MGNHHLTVLAGDDSLNESRSIGIIVIGCGVCGLVSIKTLTRGLNRCNQAHHHTSLSFHSPLNPSEIRKDYFPILGERNHNQLDWSPLDYPTVFF
jgi:hypothetical protein